MVTSRSVLDFEDLRIQPWLDGWPLKRIDIMLLSGMIIAITILLFLRWMNLLTEKHWTLSENDPEGSIGGV
jgi:hypothetical protein